ncbi:MAG TPA: hypothetical protein VIJ35_02140, partial [Bradyrhizobium sp.]
AGDSQVKAKRRRKKRMCRLRNRRARKFPDVPKAQLWRAKSDNSRTPRNALIHGPGATGAKSFIDRMKAGEAFGRSSAESAGTQYYPGNI